MRGAIHIFRQTVSDIRNAKRNRIALEALRFAKNQSSDLVNPKRPSWRVENYRYRNRRDYLFERLGVEFHPLAEFQNTKSAWAEVIESLEIPNLHLPKIYFSNIEIRDLDSSKLPAEFVIKPNIGLASIGVMLLRRTTSDSYLDLLDGKTRSWPEVVTEFEKRMSKHTKRFGNQILVQELLLDPTNPNQAPPDWKIVIGGGELILLTKVERFPANTPKGHKFVTAIWDKDLNPHPPIHFNRHISSDSTLPENIEDLIAVALEIANSFAQPVCRVDLYNLPDRIVFGEYTSNSGGHYQADKVQDARLGELWLRAEVRYNAMLLRKVQELGHPKYGRGVWKP